MAVDRATMVQSAIQRFPRVQDAFRTDPDSQTAALKVIGRILDSKAADPREEVLTFLANCSRILEFSNSTLTFGLLYKIAKLASGAEPVEKQSESGKGTGGSLEESGTQKTRSLTNSDKDDGKIFRAALNSPDYQELLERFMENRNIKDKGAAVRGLLRTAERVRTRSFYLFTDPLSLSYSRVVHRLMLNPNGNPDNIVEAMLYQ